MRKALVFLAIVAALALLRTGEPARADIPVTPVGQWGGASFDVAVSGSRAYMGMGPRLVVLDISDPSNPTLIGMSDVLPSIVQGVAISGNYAYVAARYSGLYVMDISNPACLVRVGRCDTSDYAGRVVVQGNYAYVADGAAGLRVIDISNPRSPTPVGGCGTSGHANGVAVSGSHAYVSDGSAGLQVIDVSNPASPVRVGGYVTPSYAYSVAVSGPYVCVGDSPRLNVLDVSDPTSPVRVGYCSTISAPFDIKVCDNRAYIATMYGLDVISISDPTKPVRLGKQKLENSQGVAVCGDYAYLADWSSGLRVVGISNPAAPSLVGTFYTGSAKDIAIVGSHAYIAGYTAGLQVLDITNPVSPTPVSRSYTGGYASGIAVSGHWAYVADLLGGLRLLDISDPSSPAAAGYRSINNAKDVAVQGNYAYVPSSGSYGYLVVVDVSNPAAPKTTGSCGIGDYSYGVAVSGNYAYCDGSTYGLQVVDVSSPAAPAVVGAYDDSGIAFNIAISGNYAYVADWSEGLQILNISDPAKPTRVGGCDTGGYANGITVSGSYAYVADEVAGLQVIDISHPELPVRIGGHDTASSACAVGLSGDYAYLADGDGGTVVFRIGASSPAVASITPNSAPNAGSVAIEDLTGSDFLPGASVKLTRAGQADVIGTSVMVISPTKIRCSFDLTGKAIGQWNVVVTNPDGQSATLANAFTVTDGTAPVISSVTLSPALVAGGDAVHLVVDATDDVGVTGVAADGVALSQTGASAWVGDLVAAGELGVHNVAVVARDAAGNSATDSSAAYRTALVAGLSCSSMWDMVAKNACGFCLFRLWGRVTIISDEFFVLDDGSVPLVWVRAPGYKSVIHAGDFASARGILSIAGGARWIESAVGFVTKY